MLDFKAEAEATEQVIGSAVEGPIDVQTFELETKPELDHIEVKLELAEAVTPSNINSFEVDVAIQLQSFLTD